MLQTFLQTLMGFPKQINDISKDFFKLERKEVTVT